MTIAHKMPRRLRDESFLTGSVSCTLDQARAKRPTLPAFGPFVI
jgi:hypothetical protein